MTSRNKHGAKVIGIMLAVLVLTVLSGCSGDRVVGENQSLQVRIPIVYKSTIATDYQMIVEAVDIERTLFPLEYIGGELVGEIEVLAGINRHFIAQALDRQGVVLYQGDAFADIIPGIPTELSISLVPIVPMINLTPHNQTAFNDDQYTLDVNVFGVPNLEYISLTVEQYYDTNVPSYIDTAWIGNVNSSNPYFSFYAYGSNNVDLYIENGYGEKAPDSSLTDDLGNAHLATIHFDAHGDVSSEDTLLIGGFRIGMNYVSYLNGPDIDTVPRSEIRFDNAEVRLIMPLIGK